MPVPLGGYTAANPPPPVELSDFGPSLTRQSEADQADINKILERFEVTGMMPIDQREALFIDVSNVGDYRDVVNRVREVNDYFMSLPAKVRAHFDNDPALLLDAVNDPARRQEMVDLGLVEASDKPPTGRPAGAPPAAPAVAPQPPAVAPPGA